MLDNFLQKISEDKKTGCWVWVGSKRSALRKSSVCGIMYNPYTQKAEDAHRLSWKLFREPKSITDKFVIQTCGNRLCVCPDHLSLENEQRSGDSHPSSKLTEDNVREIRAIKKRNDSRKTLQSYAEEFGVSRETIRKVILNRTSGEGSLTSSQVQTIKKNYRPPEKYDKFLKSGVSRGAIASVLSGRTWKGVS